MAAIGKTKDGSLILEVKCTELEIFKSILATIERHADQLPQSMVDELEALTNSTGNGG